MNVPYVQLRELTLDDVEDRYQWSLDRDVTKAFSFTRSISSVHSWRYEKLD